VVKLYRRHAVPFFWAMIAVVYALAVMPSSQAPDLGAGDKINHIAAFLTLTLMGRAAYRAQPGWRLGVGLSLFGALIELTQSIPILRRDASAWDWAADSAAICVALTLSMAFERRIPARATL
jgi:hypothetical protein